MSISKLQFTTVYVSDQDAALDFYVNKLGFQVAEDSTFAPGMRFLAVVPPGAQTGIVLFKPHEADSPEMAFVGTFSGIVVTADDVQATYQELADRGVYFTEPPTRQPWGGVQAQFNDQDGNRFVLHD